jgi:mono/diheme cytochrome c family protein
MPRAYGQMSDADLHSIYAYLRTVPAAGEKRPNQQ